MSRPTLPPPRACFRVLHGLAVVIHVSLFSCQRLPSLHYSPSPVVLAPASQYSTGSGLIALPSLGVGCPTPHQLFGYAGQTLTMPSKSTKLRRRCQANSSHMMGQLAGAMWGNRPKPMTANVAPHTPRAKPPNVKTSLANFAEPVNGYCTSQRLIAPIAFAIVGAMPVIAANAPCRSRRLPYRSSHQRKPF